MDQSLKTAYSRGKGSFPRKSKDYFQEKETGLEWAADAPCIEPESVYSVQGRYVDAGEHFISPLAIAVMV